MTETLTRRIPPSATDGPAADDDEIKALLAEATDAWTRGDAAGFVAVFAPDSEFVGADGVLRRGRLSNQRWHSRLFSGVFRGSRLVFEVESIRFLSAHVAVAHALSSVVYPWQAEPGPRTSSRGTWVLIRQDGRWLVSAVQHSRLRPTTGTGASRLSTTVVSLRGRLTRRPRRRSHPGRAA
ncbi:MULTISPECIES: SgcJ/EcaC family oxidoreductase [Actinoalloteichus]|uniref:DUF4440 domain-containing protein n=1 Tax=Actinoalloteichus fjordicus TaxID=1612552 RepID=A0AAC9LGK1_9PSEU|nr:MULTISPECIES: SgcJ/EcaC family oxidoreductase [Actinoalloteichus]APU16352.1 hypothetical protein UA74_21650 [Actinoalloteichus fjordicus]APU22411.1 hypothetical protein UA75_22125 [Actinoalloteichus sp. GBA129-24]